MDRRKQEALAYKASALDQQLKQLRMELEHIMMVLMELEKTKASLKELKKGEDFLFQMGSGLAAEAKLLEETFFVPVGAGYYIRTSRDNALAKVEESIGKTKDYYDRIHAEVKRAEKELIALMKEARGL